MNQSLAKPLGAPTPPATTDGRTPNLYEVWGDTVAGRDLMLSILLGGAVSLGTFGLAHVALHQVVESVQMAKAYSMLVGILGCLAGGVASAWLFKPKRLVLEQVVDPAFRQQVVAELLKEYGSLGRLEELSPHVVAELHELGLYELFREAQAQEALVREADAEPDRHLPMNASLVGGRS
ncbi:hypothetical protein [Pseudomonas mangiferae]|uniref:Uncharacterized protein n=1 Tax=Pseudomonas mangiferae TaxID=2593654 RepID=A0A553GVG5_9PSED|nr:hypothetical protein [Pseudomonas mangiferae]TRX73491.1 hypothetical protein FM069_17175 [Pseudomonas mangiferae]